MQRAVVVAKRIAGQRIERAERFIHQHDARLRGQGTRDADALALAAGEFVREAVAMLLAVEAHEIEQFIDTIRDISGGRAQQSGRDADIVC